MADYGYLVSRARELAGGDPSVSGVDPILSALFPDTMSLLRGEPARAIPNVPEYGKVPMSEDPRTGGSMLEVGSTLFPTPTGKLPLFLTAVGAGAARRQAPRALSAVERSAANLEAKFPQYAEEYPPVGPPEMKLKDKPTFPGETYPAKKLTPEAEEFEKAREKIMARMKKEGYQPYFDPEKRFDVDPSKYPGRNVDTLTLAPKKQETIDEYLKFINAPETRAQLRAGYKRGQQLGNADRWYAMGQLEAEYIKELGAKQGRKAFLEEFAAPMGATTSGNRPTPNLLMAHFLELNRKRGLPVPEEGHQLPYPVGGRRPAMNLRDYLRMTTAGGYSALGADQPKMHNFARSYIGDLDRAVMDEQMAEGMLAHAPAGFADRTRKTAFGLLEAPLHAEARRAGVRPGNYQDVAWAGFRNEPGKPMISEINEAIERTHQLTGVPRSEIVRRGLIRKEIPLYGAGGVFSAEALRELMEE